MKVSKMENCTVTEHKSKSLFDILIANKKKKKKSLITKLNKVDLCESGSPESPFLPCPLLSCTAAAALNIMQTMAAVAITGHPSSLQNCTDLHGEVKSMSRKNKKKPSQNCMKNISLEAIDLFAGGWTKIA